MHMNTIPERTDEMPIAANLSTFAPRLSRVLRVGFDKADMNSYHLGMKSTVSERGQVTIPKALRNRLGIRPGQVLEFQAENGRLVAKKDLPVNPVESIYGIIEVEGGTDRAIAALRGEAEEL